MPEAFMPHPEDAGSVVAPPTEQVSSSPSPISREIKDLSRNHAADERQEIAREFWEGRQQRRSEQEAQAALNESISRLSAQIQDAETHTITRWYTLLSGRLNRLTTELATLQEELAKSEQKQTLSQAQEEGVQERIANHYTRLRREWEELPYDRGEVERYFTAEYLSSLNQEDYLSLLRRFPASFLTHVTRQGVRDHTGMLEHTAGLNQKHDGMIQLLRDGRLRSVLGIHFAKQEDKAAIGEFISKRAGLTETDTPEERQKNYQKALEYIEYFCDENADFARYSDTSALHLAQEEVLNYFYGAEGGNECFIVWPTAYLMNEYSLHTAHSMNKDNDVWVYATEHDGIPLNAALVFLPGTTPVNPMTGSRYELNEQAQPIIDSPLVAELETALADPRWPELWQEITLARPTLADSDLTPRLAELGITTPELQYSLLHRHSHISLFLNDILPDRIRVVSEQVLRALGRYFLPAKETVPAQEFWENYFSNNPDQRPRHIVYYEGDPTHAYQTFLSERGVQVPKRINNPGTQELLAMFPDKKGAPADFDERREAFRALAIEAISERFAVPEQPLSPE